MTQSKLFASLILIAGFFMGTGQALAVCAEPAMAEYTSYPVFVTSAIKPNILIIMDNSGSMNYAAYGTWPGDSGQEITDALYRGSDPYCNTRNIRVIQSRDDSEERISNGASWWANPDFDLGEFSEDDDSLAGVRFQGVEVPQGATITNAYIEFTAQKDLAGNFSFTIRGQLNDDTVQFDASNSDISGRPDTSASVVWSGNTNWTTDDSYTTPDISAIVEEIIGRAGWVSGNNIVFKISGTGKRDAKPYDASATEAAILHIEFTPAECTRYYGYFNPDVQYTYVNNRFERDPTGEWNGNWLNWLTMRRIDVAKKVLTGGKATSRVGGGNNTLIGDPHNADSARYWKRFFDSSQSGVSVSPYNGSFWYGIKDGYLYVDDDDDPFTGELAKNFIKVYVEEAQAPEAFVDGNISGILQRVGDQARWGLEFFNDLEGGKVAVRVQDGMTTNMITGIGNKSASTNSPLAEAFYEGVRYFQQLSPYYANVDFTVNNTNDPYYWASESDTVACGKSFVLLITDGASTEDLNIPAWLQDYDADGNDSGVSPSNGSDYLDDVALWARTTDLRPAGPKELEGEQNIILYTVFAFGSGSQLLQDAAKNGGFIDKNGNNLPDLDSEWDEDGDGLPDTYYDAQDGFALERELLKAITDILERAASGTAVSVLATSGEGEGNLVQAYFRPSVTSGVTEVKWLGYLQSVWVDSSGNLREDSVGDLALDVTSDKVIQYFFDESSGEAKIKRFTVSATTPFPDTSSGSYEILNLEAVLPLWEAGSLLAQRNADDRKIFTYLDKNKDGIVDEPALDDDPFDDDGEVIRFHTSGVSNIKPYLGVKDHPSWKYLGATHPDRAGNLIEYIRGKDSGFSGTTTMAVRPRSLDGTNVWKLGDIVNSTPVSLSKPPDNYHTIYADESYQSYYDAYKDRETVVYVGANDGMLHAFTSWQYNGTSMQYIKPSAAAAGEKIGDELWAYIPQNLLPHLKWIPSTDYTHVYYVDLKPKIFDAKIFNVDATHPGGWGTVLLAGLNMGGKEICVEDDFDDGSGVTVNETRTFSPSYVAMDITDPRNPRLLWERTYQDLGMTTSIPAVIKVKEKWFAVFGSGPTDYDGTSNQKAHVFVVDLKTGDAYPHSSFASGVTDGWLFEGNENAAFMNSPSSLDKELNYNVDAVYFGETYKQGNNWKGKAYKIFIDHNWASGVTSTYIDNPNDGSKPWKFASLFTSTRPITASLSLSIDTYDNVWVYFGTGRYISTDDQTNTDTQYLFGLVDPYFNSSYDTAPNNYYHDYTTTKELAKADLFNADPYIVTTSGLVSGGLAAVTDWDSLKVAAGAEDGWFRTLTTSKERAVTKFSVLGGILFAPTFVPNADICGFGGESFLYALYYETGTAFRKSVLPVSTITVTIGGVDYEEVQAKMSLGAGKSSALGIHVGQEDGAKAFIQQSTGKVMEAEVDPALNIKSGLINWREK